MIEKLALLVRFWALKTRHATGEPLDDHEQLELLSLLQLVTNDLRVPEEGRCRRPASAVRAQLIGEGSVASVELRFVGAAALVVAAPGPLPRGARVVLRATDAVAGVEYTLPCAVLWAHGQDPVTVALEVDGVPHCVAFGAGVCAAPRPSYPPGLGGFGRKARLVA